MIKKHGAKPSLQSHLRLLLFILTVGTAGLTFRPLDPHLVLPSLFGEGFALATACYMLRSDRA